VEAADEAAAAFENYHNTLEKFKDIPAIIDQNTQAL
jgi:hypothetical protein